MLPKATLRAISRSTVTRSAVDWLTVTSLTESGSEGLWRLGNRLCSSGEQEGQLSTRWHAHGYRGSSVHGVAYGARADGAYLRLSGEKSAQHWFEALTAAEHCTRLDLAVDTHFDAPVTALVSELYVDVPNKSRHGGRPPMRRWVKDTRGGQTLYFGARSSERFGRLYDKGIEAKSHAAGLRWRWELEVKERSAQNVSQQLRSAASPVSFIQGLVAGFFHGRAGVSIAELQQAVITNEAIEPTTSSKLLQWLAIGVRPTVSRLMEVYGRERVLHALGIPLTSAVDDPSPTNQPRGATCPLQQGRSTK